MDISSLPEDLRFEIRLQVALLRNAERIQEVSADPEKFAEYIEQRKEKITKLCGNGVEVYEKETKIYP